MTKFVEKGNKPIRRKQECNHLIKVAVNRLDKKGNAPDFQKYQLLDNIALISCRYVAI